MYQLNQLIGLGLLVSILTCSSFILSDDISTTILVIEGKALLVDIDEKGEVITTYMEVPEYLTTKKNHEDMVTEAKASYMRLSKLQMDQIRFISILDQGEVFQTIMLENLEDLAAHYNQTYANQIVVTVATNDSNKNLINYNVEMIKSQLVSYGVPTNDILVDYKVDLGEDPTPFFKVSSSLRKLASL